MANAFIDSIADIGSDEEEDYDEETGEPIRSGKQRTNGATGMDDSSEEDDDDDEEAERAVREGFIVDEDEEEDVESRAQRRREKRKRRRERAEEDERLEDEDLELIGELDPEEHEEQRRFKRLKQGHQKERRDREPRGITDIFSDDEDEAAEGIPRAGLADEFDDFIEEDEFSGEEGEAELEKREVARPGQRFFTHGAGAMDGLTEAEREDMQLAFGDGQEYYWALELQDAGDEDEEKEVQLKDVFEPSQLVDKMLTDEDELIKKTDIPERFQVARKPFKERIRPDADADPEAALQFDAAEQEREQEEVDYVVSMMLPKKRFDRFLIEPFKRAVAKVLDFLNKDNFEVPFIFNHRKDYLIHSVALPAEEINGSGKGIEAHRLLTQNDIWDMVDYDLKWRAIVEKRDSLRELYAKLKQTAGVDDTMVETLLRDQIGNNEDIQDLQDYVHFQYAAQLKDLNAIEAQTNGTQKRAMSSRNMWEKIRASRVYNFVRAYGLTADEFACNVDHIGNRTFSQDADQLPDDTADSLVESPDFSTGKTVLAAGRAMFAEELHMNPRLRKYMRKIMYTRAYFDVVRTEKGLKQITDDHRFYDLKYLRHQELIVMAQSPELFLRMIKAEQEGLVQIKLRFGRLDGIKRDLYAAIESDGLSDVTSAWNIARRQVVDHAIDKLILTIGKGVKENIKAECENQLAKSCRTRYFDKLDQAPYKPKGMAKGETPRVLTLSSGQGVFNRDAICWTYLEEAGRCLEHGKFVDLRLGNAEKFLPDGKDVEALVELVRRRRPDVIGVSGFSAETKKLHRDLTDIVEKFDLQSNDFSLDDDDDDPRNGDEGRSNRIEVVMVNDEVARLYHTSERAALEFPSYPPLTRYCVALARYMQNPMLEYASLKRDIISINFDDNQDAIPQDKLLKYLDEAMVDMVNLVGLDIEEALAAPNYVGNIVPYVCGLGPRKAAHLMNVIDANGGQLMNRQDLFASPEKEMHHAMGPVVFQNAASFIVIPYDKDDPESDYLDNTRIHPEDYDLARKIAGDALELDEEDVKNEQDEYGPHAVVRKLRSEDNADRVNDLVLEDYAENLLKSMGQRKRATLESIRAELEQPYDELRNPFEPMSSNQIFTMLTGETEYSLQENMIVPVQIRRVFQDHIEARLDCGVEGGVGENEYPEGVGGERGIDVRSAYQPHQTVQGKILFLNRKALTAQLTFREDALRRPFKREHDPPRDEWDWDQELKDKDEAVRQKEQKSGRAQRVIKHPLFKPFNAPQAEEYLGSQSRGDVVIRPSSKGPDHLTVTWKVADGVYQHIDVLELDKDNEFSVGKTLKIGGQYTYSDLDELIVNHVKGMARKVEDLMADEKYQNGSKNQTDQWLTTYTEANPKRSMYAFCINSKFPGYFNLCFKAGQHAQLGCWSVKILPDAYEVQKMRYNSVSNLKNGFKILFQNHQRPQDIMPAGVRRR